MLIASWPASGFKQHETSWRLFKPELWSGLQLASFPVTETRLAGLCHALYILEARLELKLPHNTASNQRILKSWVLIICIHTDVIQCVDNVTKSKINVHTKNQEWHTKKTGQPIYLSLILNPDPFNQSLWHCPFLSSACAAIPYPLPFGQMSSCMFQPGIDYPQTPWPDNLSRGRNLSVPSATPDLAHSHASCVTCMLRNIYIYPQLQTNYTTPCWFNSPKSSCKSHLLDEVFWTRASDNQ